MHFDDAFRRFSGFLAEVDWPQQIIWIEACEVIEFPRFTIFVFRPSQSIDLADVRAVFEASYAVVPAVHFHGVAHANGHTFAFIRPIQELAQGEQMFVVDGLKLSVSSAPPRMVVVKSRLHWWWVNRQHRSWQRRLDRALGAA